MLKRLSWLFAVTLCAAPVHAQEYPTRPIRLIVPLAPAGGMDTIARGVAQKLTESLGQSVVVDNRSGGGGVIGVETVAHSTPDGYTLLMMSATALIYPLMYKAKYDIARDFAPIVQVTTQPYVIVVNPTVPVKSVAELIAYAKANPNKLNFASSGNGSLIHLMTELFKSSTGAQMTHVPYRGIGAAYPTCSAARSSSYSRAASPRCSSSTPAGCGRSRSRVRSGRKRCRNCRR